MMKFRRLLQDAQTGLFYVGNGVWTSNPVEAYAFEDCANAAQVGRGLKGGALYLVLKFPDSKMDLTHLLGDINFAPDRTRSLR
jgi:hypothetical protein